MRKKYILRIVHPPLDSLMNDSYNKVVDRFDRFIGYIVPINVQSIRLDEFASIEIYRSSL